MDKTILLVSQINIRGIIHNPTKFNMIPKVTSQKNQEEKLSNEKEQHNHAELQQ